MKTEKQFTFNLEKNTLKESMKSGNFVALFEIDPPSSDCNLSSVISRYQPIIESINAIDTFNSGIAITDKRANSNSLNVLDFAAELIKEKKNNSILFLSGRGIKQIELEELIKSSIGCGFWNIVPVSGAIYKEDTEKNILEEYFTESTALLNCLKNNNAYNTLNLGTAVNPFKYSQVSLYTQYFKLIKKIHAGANFVVVQAGWDIFKHQEIRWHLETRGQFEPCIGRIILLKPETIEQIITGSYHGIFMSPDFLSILKKESKFGLSQFWAAQWRRFELQVAGLRWLGYSGIIISGIDNALQVKTAANKINNALKEFSSFEEWHQVYHNFLARSEMSPYPYKYYKYSNLLENPFADSAIETLDSLPSCGKSEKLNYYLNKFKTKNHLDSKLFFLSPKICPKKMIHGVCGEMNHDGTCCLNANKECLFSRMFKIASWQKNFEIFEQ